MTFEEELEAELAGAPTREAPIVDTVDAFEGDPNVRELDAAPAVELKVVEPGAVHPMAAQWAKWRPAFAEAMAGGFQTIDALERQVLQGRVQFWPGKDAALVTEIVSYDGGERAIQGLWAAGDLAKVVELIPGAEAYGRLMGCTSVLVEGQAAWARILKPMGYERWSVTLKKSLT
jgi:hypothetical protein